eukprot:Awhi_evm2s15230
MGFEIKWAYQGFDAYKAGDYIGMAETMKGLNGTIARTGCFGADIKGGCSKAKYNKLRAAKNPDDPELPQVLHLPYLAGEGSTVGGSQFYIDIKGIEDEAILKYKLRYSENFEWVKGGKLPGLFGGSKSCSGNRPVTGNNCFSAR